MPKPKLLIVVTIHEPIPVEQFASVAKFDSLLLKARLESCGIPPDEAREVTSKINKVVEKPKPTLIYMETTNDDNDRYDRHRD